MFRSEHELSRKRWTRCGRAKLASDLAGQVAFRCRTGKAARRSTSHA